MVLVQASSCLFIGGWTGVYRLSSTGLAVLFAFAHLHCAVAVATSLDLHISENGVYAMHPSWSVQQASMTKRVGAAHACTELAFQPCRVGQFSRLVHARCRRSQTSSRQQHDAV